MPISLPETDSDEAFKYVREAVRGHPELYFARLVIFGEGPSEEIVLRRLFEASGTPLDTHFISVVPLGGRHVNHFWRLVHDLEIPHLTLLDLDREKEGAGWARIQYVRNELVKRFGPGSPSLEFEIQPGSKHTLANAAYDKLIERDVSETKKMDAWLSLLEEKFDVFFSSPLDIDFAMLESFPDIYKEQAERGPRLPEPNSAEYPAALLKRIKQVLSADAEKAPDTTGSTYTQPQRELFPWYKYLFVDGSKPVSHMRATIAISDADLLENAPAVLTRLVERAKALVSPGAGAK
jgi:predicted ATP-dependent endonuclease of OLD family